MNIKSFFILILLGLFSTLLNAQNSNLDWAISMGNTQLDEGNSILSDSFGNIYVIGNFHGTVDFDPGSGKTNLKSNGIYDLFVQKLDASGNLIWAKSMGGTASEICNSATIDNNGNIYLTGFFKDSADFDPNTGRTMLYSNGQYDIFILKIDSSGNLKWAASMGGALSDKGSSIHTDQSGNVYTTGVFQTTSVDFDPGSGIRILHGKGGSDIFIQKLNSSGKLLWAKSIGSSYNEYSACITTDINENVFITGRYGLTVDFDPNSGIHNLTSVSGTEDVFITKLDVSGNLTWAKSIGGTRTDEGNFITTDIMGNLYISGNFQGTVDFDPGSNVVNLSTGSSFTDPFLLKMNSSGEYIWVISIKGTDVEINRSVCVSKVGDIYLTGQWHRMKTW